MRIRHLYKKLNQVAAAGLAASLFVSLFAFSACDSSNALLETDSGSANITPSVANLADKLELSAQQSQNINDLVAKKGADEPGTLWYVAAELQQTLTADQKSALLKGMEEAREKRTGDEKSPRTRGPERFQMRRENLEAVVGDLSDTQKAELKALHEKHREEMKSLFSQRREGNAANREEMEAAGQKMRDAMEAELATILTGEQLAAVKAAREKREGEIQKRRDAATSEKGTLRRGRQGGRFGEDTREAFSAAKDEALGLTAEQKAQIETLTAAQKEKAAALFEEIRAGDEGREAAREKVEALRESSKNAMAEILTKEQEETISIHRALAFNLMKDRTGDTKGRRGSRRFDR